MNNKSIIALLLLAFISAKTYAQEEENYVEFNDRNNIVHGVYVGINVNYGEIDGKATYMSGFKVAYVANQQFEVGFEGKFIYSDQDVYNSLQSRTEDLIGGYGGLHLEPIFFSKSRFNLSFPLLIGAGGVGYIRSNSEHQEELTEEDFVCVFIAEPGVSVLYNLSRFLQLEAGIKYRLSSKIEFPERPLDNINGFSAGIGIKMGIFNMGRNRYKKNISDEE